MLTVQVLYFAVLRERLGLAKEEVALPAGSTAADLLTHLGTRHPLFAEQRGLRRSLQVAVNQQMVPLTEALHDGDEVALIPPVAGGADAPATARCRLSAEPLRWQEVIDAVSGPTQGGIVVFCGAVRDHNDGKRVVHLEYEAYDAMAVRSMAAIVARIEAATAGVRVAMVHRTGRLQIGEPAVLIAASAPHRAEAFAACRAAIEQLKQEVPIWKKEFGEDGSEWLSNRPG